MIKIRAKEKERERERESLLLCDLDALERAYSGALVNFFSHRNGAHLFAFSPPLSPPLCLCQARELEEERRAAPFSLPHRPPLSSSQLKNALPPAKRAKRASPLIHIHTHTHGQLSSLQWPANSIPPRSGRMCNRSLVNIHSYERLRVSRTDRQTDRPRGESDSRP